MVELTVKKAKDFTVNGHGDNKAWKAVKWINLPQVGDTISPYGTRFKMLYSDSGMYFLVDSEDKQLTCRKRKDFDDIFKDDVVEVFLWPDQKQNFYFEYEISPLEKELVLLIPNNKGKFMGWQAWHFENGRKTQKAVSIRGGQKKLMAKVDGWVAEFFIPFSLMVGFNNVPPKPKMIWRANIYRMDYDTGELCKWAWCPDVGGQFHNFKQFGKIVFE
jgi:hypothetical protein